MAAPDRFIAWCEQGQASIEQQLELLKAGKVRTGEDIGAGWIDTTTESIERAQARLSELNELLTATGSATVIKPDALQRDSAKSDFGHRPEGCPPRKGRHLLVKCLGVRDAGSRSHTNHCVGVIPCALSCLGFRLL